ncbi:hypothetical protein MPSEU_000830100 [Mayamaea pseudoterrestris]|nr:hypothetical protein MPSEU_000830100 [Mayamaea pseudoterrestris]
MRLSSTLSLLVAGVALDAAIAFRLQRSSHTSSRTLHSTLLFVAPPSKPSEGSSNMPDEENTSYTGSIDWDEEWKKVVREQKITENRPGKDFYKSDAEIAAIRAANKATKQVDRIAEDLVGGMELPTWDSVKGDWKFWIGVLAAISVGGALLSAVSIPTDVVTSADSNASPGSYFI